MDFAQAESTSHYRPSSDTEPFPEIPGVYRDDNESIDNWNSVVEHLSKKETERCSIWRDEVQNILVFAGLFSAVVTAFITETHTSLQSNPSEVLLGRIAAALENSANATSSLSAQAGESLKISPSFPDKVVNTLWFVSLALSLSSALIGLVALQWLREHLRPSPQNVPLRTLPALIQMQAEALDAYYIPQTFTTLPLLLIASLILFFVGLIIFLWNINHTIAAPAIVVISLLLLFILYTTLRPSMHGLPRPSSAFLSTGQSTIKPSIQCPYKSPQSWACLQAIFLISDLISPILRLVGRTVPSTPIRTTRWSDWAISWLRQRDIDYLRSTRDQHSLLRPFRDKKLIFPPVYDTVRALTRVKEDFSSMGHKTFRDSMTHVIAVFKDFLAFHHGSQGFSDQLLDYVHVILDEPPLPIALPKALFSRATREIKASHTELLFHLSGVTNLNGVANSVRASLVATIPDLVLFTTEHLDEKIDVTQPCSAPIALVWNRASRYRFNIIADGEKLERQLIEKYIRILDQIFQYAQAQQTEVGQSQATLGTSPYIKTVLHAIANILVEYSRVLPEDTIPRHDELLTRLDSDLQVKTPPNPYLFFLGSIYAHFLLVEVSPRFIHHPVYERTQAFDNLASTLKRCHQLLQRNRKVDQYKQWVFPSASRPDFLWKYLEPHLGAMRSGAARNDDIGWPDKPAVNTNVCKDAVVELVSGDNTGETD